MSHFRLLVITDEAPSEDVLAKVLQPFHEYECTGKKDEHVVFRDCTDEVLAEWNKLVECYRGPDGELYSGDEEDIFYRPATPEEEAKIGPLGGFGCRGDLIYRTVYERKVLVVRDPMLQQALQIIGNTGTNIPRGYRLASEDEQKRLRDLDGDEGTTDGQDWKRLTVRLPEPEVLVRFVPEGYVMEMAPKSSLFPSIGVFVTDWFGYEERDGKFGRETNVKKWLWLDADGKELGRTHDDATLDGVDPEAPGIQKILIGGSKWDWWAVGGRYEGMLRVRPKKARSVYSPLMEKAGSVASKRGASVTYAVTADLLREVKQARLDGSLTDVEVRGICAHLRRHGANAEQVTAEQQKILALPLVMTKPIKANSCQMRDLVLATMQAEAMHKAGELYDGIMAVVNGRAIPIFDKLCEQYPDVDEARQRYWNDPVSKDLAAAGFRSFDGYEDYVCTREVFVERERLRAFSAFAVLKDGRCMSAARWAGGASCMARRTRASGKRSSPR